MRYLPILLAAAALFANAGAFAAPCHSAHSIASVHNHSGRFIDTVRFDLNGPSLRPYSVKVAHPPFIADPSGETIHVDGSKFRTITFTNVVWTCTIHEHLILPGRAVRDIKKLGQFEGVVEYAIGYGRHARYLGAYAYKPGSHWRVVLRFLR